MNTDVDPDGLGIDVREIASMLFRRRYWLVIPVIAGVLFSIIAITLQKPVYRSSATLLIDSQQIPTSLVASPLTSIANERIAKIKQQIVSRDSLTQIIDRLRLYARERSQMPFDDVLDIMRGAIGVDLVGATQGESGTGKTIAFTLSFSYEDALAAQAVTSNLTNLFLREDKRFRTEQASGTAAFLGRRAEELRGQLGRLGDERREIEARFSGALPSQVGMSAQSEAALRAEVSRIDSESQGLAQQNSLLAARQQELAHAPAPEGEALRRAEEKFDLLSATYSDNFPEVVAAKVAVARQRAAVRQMQPSGSGNAIASEIAAGRARIDMLARRRSALVATISDMDRRTALAPQASYELNIVEREYDNIKRQYEDLREKQLEANVAANLQAEGKGERFSIVDEPSMPHEALGSKPLSLLLTGLIGGVCAGVVLVLAFEFTTGAIHGEATLTRLVGAPPIGVVPFTRTPRRSLAGFLRALLRRRSDRGESYAD